MSPLSTEPIAAVDLGSNSFHMIVAQVSERRLQVIDRLKEMVRLAAGLDERNFLSNEIMDQAIECLRRFGQRLRGIPSDKVRAVGTNTLRKARNRAKFLARAEHALGHPIEIIAGREEARLIYLGVSHNLEDGGERRLVIDIGGGSTELILGQQFKPERMDSLYIGCVELSNRLFKDGRIDTKRMRAAEIAALQEFEPVKANYRRLGWDCVIGASGTILAIHDIVANAGWSKEGITVETLDKLRKSLIHAGHVERLALQGLQPERAPVFPGGVAILSAAFEALEIERMRAASGALREGLLYDLLGRIHHEDVREGTIENVMHRYQINRDQVQRVANTALYLLAQTSGSWGIKEEEYTRLLHWAASLHEIGLAISYSQYQKHGAYLVQNLDMPGFSQDEQQLLAVLIRGHRRKYPVAELGNLPRSAAKAVRYLCLLLRLSVVLHRSQTDQPLPSIQLEASDANIKLLFPAGWLDRHPLTRADLEQEANYLAVAGIELRFE
jgi:exopolyphosphatase / guanosine-5'-triphosphate,3'-diphosphate pyrophosphatase